MKKHIFNISALGLLLIFIFFTNCKKEEIPVVTLKTYEATNITSSSAMIQGEIISDGGAAITKRGVCISAKQNPTLVDGHVVSTSNENEFLVEISGLKPNTKFYYRAFAVCSSGIFYGGEMNFTTLITAPIVSTSEVTEIVDNAAVCGGEVLNDGGTTVTARGVCWSVNQNPTVNDNKTVNGNGLGIFTSEITNLSRTTNYYVRAYAISSYGTVYGEQRKFATNDNGSPISDIDGNTYNTVWINGCLWMKENLKTTKYRDGSDIPNVTYNEIWAELSTSAYCWYNNDIANKPTYGALYNFFTVSTGNLCPTGWHVPTDEDWTALVDYAGGFYIAGTKLKATSGWNSGGNGTDEYGFSALPGGARNPMNGTFYGVGSSGYWWSNTESEYLSRGMFYDSEYLFRVVGDKEEGSSVRCVKD